MFLLDYLMALPVQLNQITKNNTGISLHLNCDNGTTFFMD